LALDLGDGSKNCEWIYRFWANPGTPGSGLVPLAPVLAPGTALGSRPRVALSSAQAPRVYCGPRPPGNSRLGGVLAKRGDRVPLDVQAKTSTDYQGLRPEKDCHEMSCAIMSMDMLLSKSTFRKGGSSANGSRSSEATDLSCHLLQQDLRARQGAPTEVSRGTDRGDR
jgi:hypothetical protein